MRSQHQLTGRREQPFPKLENRPLALSSRAPTVTRCFVPYRVTSKGRNIILNPLQSKEEILNSLVTIDPGAFKSHETKGAKSVVDGDKD
jgi:hypothetical protein